MCTVSPTGAPSNTNNPQNKFMKIVGGFEIEEKMTLTGGDIVLNGAEMHFNLSPQGFVTGFKIILDLLVRAEVEGYEVHFNSEISHTYTPEEFAMLIYHLKNKEK